MDREECQEMIDMVNNRYNLKGAKKVKMIEKLEFDTTRGQNEIQTRIDEHGRVIR